MPKMVRWCGVDFVIFRSILPDIKTICKFAQMEFKYGDAERGRTMFEGIMTNYPKRVDLWNIFLDMEIRIGDLATIR
jgi:rRNA biogenesis protein RRP5